LKVLFHILQLDKLASINFNFMLLKFQISQWYFSRKLLYIKIRNVECFGAILVNFSSVLFNCLESWSFSGTKDLKFTENIVHNPTSMLTLNINLSLFLYPMVVFRECFLFWFIPGIKTEICWYKWSFVNYVMQKPTFSIPFS